MPYVLDAKSGCRRASRPIDRTYASERAATGALEMSWFHGSSAGKTGQPANVVAAATARRGSARKRSPLAPPAPDAHTSWPHARPPRPGPDPAARRRRLRVGVVVLVRPRAGVERRGPVPAA